MHVRASKKESARRGAELARHCINMRTDDGLLRPSSSSTRCRGRSGRAGRAARRLTSRLLLSSATASRQHQDFKPTTRLS
eukprot:scaffold69384_cov44-Phaeocystis_antarctica.AAC.2